MNYNQIAKDVIEAVGGKENITHAMHCATRLRLTLKDETLINENAVTDVEGVKGTFNAKGQYQIIFGSGLVNLVCQEVCSILGFQNETPQVEEKEEGNLLQRAVKLLSDIFVPIIPAIVAGGLLMGLNNILTAQGLVGAGKSIIDVYPQFKDLATMINVFANAAFTFLPVLIGFSATKKFGGNPYLGAAMGMIMVHPDLLNAYSYGKAGIDVPTWNIFGLAIEAVGYQGTVLPVLGVSWILANIEKRLHKVTPTWLDNLTTPMLSILVTGFITFICVGPILRQAGIYLADGISWMYNTLGFIGGGLFGFFYAPIVLTGMHHSFIAVETQLLASIQTTGGSFIFPTASMSNVAQGAAVLAVLALTKDKKLKSICSASGVSALLGITEPAMFGVTLKLKYPFIGAMCGSGVGSAYLAGTHVLSNALGAAGIPGFLSIPVGSYLNFGIGMVLAFVVSFIVTVILFKRENGKASQHVEKMVLAPMKGEVKNISEISDPTFAGKMMGDGFMVLPENGDVVAPFDGEVMMIFPTKHALGLKSVDGEELLIHCGLDTVNLNGEPFEVKVHQGDQIKAGQLLMKADLNKIKEAGCSIETAVVITNGVDFEMIQEGKCEQGTQVLKVKG